MTRLTYFSTLPPKPEYISKINKVLSNGELLTLSEIQAKAKLTRTQVTCTLDLLIQQKKIQIELVSNRKKYQRT